MNIVEYKDDRHYETMCSWWEHYEWVPCPAKSLPRYGLVAEENGEVIAYIGAYAIDEQAMVFIEWAVANPKMPKDIRHEALDKLFHELCKVASDKGCSYAYSVTANKSWGSRLMTFGMTVAEQNATSYVMPLTNLQDISFISD